MNKKISIIGLGFVGLPMLVNLASKKLKKKYNFEVLGIERNDEVAKKKITQIRNGILPIKSNDKELNAQFKNIHRNNKIKISTNIEDIKESDIIVISIGFDFSKKNSIKNVNKLFSSIGSNLKKGSLILIETTMPPGTCEKIIYPTINKQLLRRKIKSNDIYFGYSFERIMPGVNYINSINNNFRAYSGINNKSKKKIKVFLESFINFKKFPLQEFNKIEECELCKIIENSYRSINIAFIDEWMKFSKKRNLNLNKILEVIRIRPTHKNIMKTGIGVGGYCLTKDSNFANLSNKLFDKQKINFPISDLGNKINSRMINNSIDFIFSNIKNLKTKSFLVLGSTYKEDVGDFRHSPSVALINNLKKKIKNIKTYDPFLDDNKDIIKIKTLKKFDVLIFCVSHDQFKKFNFSKIIKFKNYCFDLNHVIPKKNLDKIDKKKNKIFILGDY